MKITYIANARIPTEKAHGIQIMKMCQAFSAAGHKLELVLPMRSNKVKDNPFSYYGISRVFRIKRFPCLDLIPYSDRLGNFGLWVESLTFFFPVMLYMSLKKTDFIYTRNKFILPLVFLKKNMVYEAHTFPRNYFLYAAFLKKAKGMVVITQKLKDSFVENGIPAQKILVAPDGVDLKMFDIQLSKEGAREKLNLPQDKKIVLYTGHLYKWKGVDILVEAAKSFIGKAEVYLVGGMGKDIAKLKAQSPKVKIIGHRPYEEMPVWLKAADVLVLPNSSKEEISKNWTSPMKLFEYMSAKRPIVASRLPSILEVLNKENSILVEPDNPAALASGINKVLDDSVLPERISIQAFEDVQKYSWSERANNILSFFSAK